jgi:hypothetical protein
MDFATFPFAVLNIVQMTHWCGVYWMVPLNECPFLFFLLFLPWAQKFPVRMPFLVVQAKIMVA